MASAREVVLGFMQTFERGDLRVLRESLADDFTGHITTADGGVRDVDRDGYVESVRAMDVPTAHLRLDIPNVVEIEPGRVLVMVEVHAQVDGKLSEIWMVDALPAESDDFWQ
jgi:ketosteroid isomerase-like protein